MKEKSFSKNESLNDINIFDGLITNLVHNFEPKMLSYLKSKINENSVFFNHNGSFELEFVVDTNILFSEVRSIMVNGSCFFLKIMNNPFIKFYGPKKLREELYAKIELKFPKEKKTKGFNIDECLKKADLLLSKISIKENIQQENWNKAKSYLDNRDSDDIAFVALNFNLKTHGIITNDKDIRDQKDIRTWELKEVGKILTEISKGSLSFVISSSIIKEVFSLIIKLIKYVWYTFLKVIDKIIKSFNSLINAGIKTISSPQKLILISLGIIIVDQIGVGINVIWEEIKIGIKAIINFLKKLLNLFVDFFEVLEPIISDSTELLSYFLKKSNDAIETLKNLEKTKPA